jgi:hypothetical protein
MNTSTIIVIALAFTSAAVKLAQPAACSNPAAIEKKLPGGVTAKRVSPAEFQREYAEVGMAQTMHNE